MKNQTIVIIGANSGIAKALALQTIENNDTQLVVISRNNDAYQDQKFSETKKLTLSDYTETSIASAINDIKAANMPPITGVFICNGLLHNQTIMPEKRLQEFTADSFMQIIEANTITPVLWLKNLLPIMKGKQPCKMVVFTARVGSISDNKIGGWYSYRTSKAAINMLLKSAAVELSRTAKNIKLISFHPGTTDTPLSKPFQKNVPENKLFTSKFVANQLFNIVKNIEIDGQASFLDWQGKDIPW